MAKLVADGHVAGPHGLGMETINAPRPLAPTDPATECQRHAQAPVLAAVGVGVPPAARTNSVRMIVAPVVG